LIVLMILATGCAEVGPQEGGVRTTMIGLEKGFGEGEWFQRGIKSNPLAPGLYFSIPHLTVVEKYPVKELRYHMFRDAENARDDVAFKTKDGQIAWIDVTVRYRLVFDKLPQLHRRYGRDYVDSVIRPTVRSLVNNKLGEYSAELIYDGTTRQIVADEIREIVNKGVKDQPGTMEQGLEVTEVLFRRFEFTEDYQQAIEQKRIAAEQHLAAVEWAKKRQEEARGEKMALIQDAEGKAEKIRLESEANLYAKLKEAEGVRQIGLAHAEAQEALARAIGGGDVLVRLEFARHLAQDLKVWGVPTGQENNSIMDLSGVFGSMFPRSDVVAPALPVASPAN
ncbi:prohibitin family protein, partial [bacterium]|nr:prohibitin family protein [candidate division CSSED10-310 bacterium]